jgi:prepilin peptidase CpaA
VAEHGIWITALAVSCGAAYWDFLERRIPNALTATAFLLGLPLNGLAAGWPGVRNSLEGAGVALALLLPLVLLRGLGAGDWKLMGSLGALLGPERIIFILLATVFLSGIVALVQAVARKRLGETLGNLWELMRGFFVYGLMPHPEIRLDHPGAVSLPFGSVAAVATVFCFWLGRPGG